VANVAWPLAVVVISSSGRRADRPERHSAGELVQVGLRAADAFIEAKGLPVEPDLQREWEGKAFDVLDDNISNVVRQMLLAMAGMFAAFLAATYSADALDLPTRGIGLLIRGGLFCLFGSISIFVTSARPIRTAISAQRSAIAAHERRLVDETERHRLTTRLQDAFEMAEGDLDAFTVVSEALGLLTDDAAEMLLADSSRAHLHRVAESTTAGPVGCGVESPWACPAVRRNRTLEFSSPSDIDSCPRLKERSDVSGSALCVPVTVLGAPMGVIHVAAEQGGALPTSTRNAIETVANQAGSRIGVLRAMAQSQLQATTDPLTGLLNRRSLEAELTTLRNTGRSYALAFFDLDHFKQLNDTYGHETGDRALRSFAGLLRRTIREQDIACRYGGEEFVVVFPDQDSRSAHPVVERVGTALASATDAGDMPLFTVSAGVADSTQSSEATNVIRLADGAMFRAKQAGRARVELTAGLDLTPTVFDAA